MGLCCRCSLLVEGVARAVAVVTQAADATRCDVSILLLSLRRVLGDVEVLSIHLPSLRFSTSVSFDHVSKASASGKIAGRHLLHTESETYQIGGFEFEFENPFNSRNTCWFIY